MSPRKGFVCEFMFSQSIDAMDALLRLVQMRQRIFQFFRKPTATSVFVVAAAGLWLAVAVQKRPVGWTPVAEAKIVLLPDFTS